MKLVATFDLRKLVDQQTYDRLLKAEIEMKAARQAALEAVYKTPEGSLINKVGHLERADFNPSLTSISIWYSVTQMNHVEWIVGEKNPNVKTYLPESVANSLLHGKLLNDEEKRQLLIDQGWLKPATT